MKKAVAVISIALGIILAAPAFSEDKAPLTPISRDRINIQLEKIRADKKFVTSENMALTDAEAKVFWPVYEEYQEGLHKINGRLADLILAYADAYNNKNLTNEKAAQLINDALAVDAEELALKQAFVPKLLKVLPAVKAARYMQIENKLRGIVKVKLGEQVPLAE